MSTLFAGVAAALSMITFGVQEEPLPYPNWVDPGYLQVVWARSPNFNERPEGTKIDTIVLHHTAGSTLVSCVRWFAMERSRVSAHYTVGKDGSIVKHLDWDDRGWHAGASKDYTGREGVNDYSIGIEIVNKGDGSEPWTEEQVRAVKFLCMYLQKHLPITQIVSHEYIALPPGRKPDPLDYPWQTLEDLGVLLFYGRMDRFKEPRFTP